MDKEATISTEGLDRAILVWMQELSPHGICVTDTELRVQGWNSWLEASSGLNKSQVIGRELKEVFPELHTRRLDAYFKKALEGQVSVLSSAFHGYLFPLPSPIREAGFSNMLQTSRIAPLMQEGEIVGTITTIEDVTEREYQNSLLRRQHERQELFSWALAHLLQSKHPETMVKEIFPRISAHIGVDVYFNYLFDSESDQLRLHSAGGISAGLQQQLGVLGNKESICEVSAAQRQTIVLSRLDQSEDTRAQSLKQMGLRAYVCHPLHVDGKIIGTLSFGSRGRNNFEAEEIEFTRIVAQYVAIAIERSRNMEALRKAQDELSRHAESLEKKVQERTAKLRESIGELESFSYSLAHDVRAPLRHIQGFAQALIEDCGEELSVQARNYVDLIARAIRKLDALTDDILTYSQVSREALNLVPIDLESAFRNIFLRNPSLGAPGVVTIKGPLHRVLAERVLLDQCLSHLLDNAIKFVPAGVTPNIILRTELRKEETSGGASSNWIRIWVEDNGIGISPEFHTRIFGIFERLATNSQGTGIGLAIVSKAIQRMGGRLGVESETGRGSKFWLQVPAAD